MTRTKKASQFSLQLRILYVKLPLVHQSDHQQYYGSLIKYLSQYHFYQKY